MAISPRTHAVVSPFRAQFVSREEVGQGLEAVLGEIERVLDECAELAPQAADAPPINPRIGTIRRAVAPWDPLNTGDAWVWYTGSGWAAL